MQDSFTELHVLVHALHGGNALSQPVLTQACQFLQAVFAEQRRTGACLRATAPGSTDSDTATDIDSTGTSDTSAAFPEQTLPAAAPADASSQSRRAEAPTAHAQSVREVSPGDASSPEVAQPPASAPQAADAPQLTPDEDQPCFPPFSVFTVRPVIRSAGYGPQLDLLSQVAQYADEASIATVHLVCKLPAAQRDEALCAGAADADASALLPCDADACAEQPPQCTVSGVDPCGLFNALQPSADELTAVAKLPAEPLNANGCQNIDWQGLQDTLAAFKVLLAWSERASELADFALLVNALVDTSFAESGGAGSAATRIVFGVPRRTRTDGDAGATLAAAAARLASQYKSADAEFIWRSWRYFDVYAGHALVRDVAFSAGSLAFLLLYTWAHIGSLVLTLLVVGAILMSLPLALALYALLLGVRWIGVLHFLGIFIVLGIGADDMYVMLDHWKARFFGLLRDNIADLSMI